MRKAIRSPLLALALIVVVAGTVIATDGSSNFGPPELLARGTVSESVNFNTGAVKFQTKGSVDLVTQKITIGPSGHSGWHAHPGVVLVTVAVGSLERLDKHCSATVYTAGTESSAFVESGNHAGLVRNRSTTTDAVVYVTFIVPKGTTALRIDKLEPRCA